MSIEFDEDNFTHIGALSSTADNPRTGSKIGNWLVKSGLATDAFAANIIMIIAALCIFGISVYFFKYGFHLPVPVDKTLIKDPLLDPSVNP